MRDDNPQPFEWRNIGGLARLAGCSVDTIRFYERFGLMPRPRRSQGGQRRYGKKEIRLLLLIRRLRELSFGLDEIAGLVRQRGSCSCSEFKRSADARIAQTRSKIDELLRLERSLKEISARCDAAELDHCAILDVVPTTGIGMPGLPVKEMPCCARLA